MTKEMIEFERLMAEEMADIKEAKKISNILLKINAMIQPILLAAIVILWSMI